MEEPGDLGVVVMGYVAAEKSFCGFYEDASWPFVDDPGDDIVVV